MPRKNSAIVAITSDHHVGSTIGLMPPIVYTDDDESVLPNKLQRQSYDFWHNGFWTYVWKLAKQKDVDVITVFNGDSVDGNHHNTSQIWTNSDNVQCAAAVKLFKPIVAKSKAAYFTRGTAAHVQPSAASDELIAKECEARAPSRSSSSRSSYHLKLNICGLLFDICHHGPNPGSRVWNYGDALRKYTKTVIFDCLARRERCPDVLIRSHVHKKCWETVRDYGHTCEAFITPAWQWKTEYAHRVASQDDVADVGGFIIEIDDGAISKSYFKVISVSQADVVVV